MSDHLDRLIAYTGSPDVYDAPSIEELCCALDEIQRFREIRASLRSALREAFDEGAEQGSDEATAYEWGSPAMRTREEAFNEALESYNRGSIANVLALAEGGKP